MKKRELEDLDTSIYGRYGICHIYTHSVTTTTTTRPRNVSMKHQKREREREKRQWLSPTIQKWRWITINMCVCVCVLCESEKICAAFYSSLFSNSQSVSQIMFAVPERDRESERSPSGRINTTIFTSLDKQILLSLYLSFILSSQ